MSSIELAAKKVAGEMARPGRSITLDAYAQAQLATWAFLRGVILQYTGAEQLFVPDVHVKELFQRRRPPMQSRIWMVAYNRPFALTTYRASGGEWNPPATGEIYILTLSVGVLAFHIFGHTSQMSYDHDFSEPHPGLMRIWPASGPVSWPSPVGFDDARIEQLHTSMPANWSEEAQAIREQAIADRIRNRQRLAGRPAGGSLCQLLGINRSIGDRLVGANCQSPGA
jgi:hypothetical protein